MTSDGGTVTSTGSQLASLGFPEGEILVLHVRLRELFGNRSSLLGPHVDTYSDAARGLIALIREHLKPSAMLVPSFTYSFTKTGVFDRANTIGEVGRFGNSLGC
jgi:aminoglycoside N3'-acetyltransferase